MPTIKVISDDTETKIDVEAGANLRQTLLNNGFSPYTRMTSRLNCGGRGLCATCGVWIESDEPKPSHWHDQLASRFGYPRLSCQVTVNTNMTILILDDKIIWGGRNRDRAGRLQP